MLKLAWGKKYILIPIKKGVELTEIQPNYPFPLSQKDICELIKKDLYPFRSQLKKDSSIVIILEDPSRPSQTGTIIESICQGITEVTGNTAQVEVIIAAGAHYQIQPAELNKKIGRLKYPLTIHDSTDAAQLIRAGAAQSGIPLYFNKKVVEAGLRLSISTMNVHPLAGFSGGGKILLPGVAGLETIKAFHRLPPGNPGEETSAMRDLINETLTFLPIDFSWHLISRPEGEVINIFGGKLQESFQQAKTALLKLISVKKPENLADLLLLGCNPFNQNLIGTFKSLHQIPLLLKPGGSVILFNEAPQGIGFHHWRNQPNIVVNQQEHYQALLKKYRVAVFAPEIKEADFYNTFPASFQLLSSMALLEQFLNEVDYSTVHVLPYAPLTLITN